MKYERRWEAFHYFLWKSENKRCSQLLTWKGNLGIRSMRRVMVALVPIETLFFINPKKSDGTGVVPAVKPCSARSIQWEPINSLQCFSKWYGCLNRLSLCFYHASSSWRHVWWRWFAYLASKFVSDEWLIMRRVHFVDVSSGLPGFCNCDGALIDDCAKTVYSEFWAHVLKATPETLRSWPKCFRKRIWNRVLWYFGFSYRFDSDAWWLTSEFLRSNDVSVCQIGLALYFSLHIAIILDHLSSMFSLTVKSDIFCGLSNFEHLQSGEILAGWSWIKPMELLSWIEWFTRITEAHYSFSHTMAASEKPMLSFIVYWCLGFEISISKWCSSVLLFGFVGKYALCICQTSKDANYLVSHA